MGEFSEEELKAYMLSQIHEIDKFIYEMGFKLNQNPLNILSRQEWAFIWIQRHAKEYHDNYIKNIR